MSAPQGWYDAGTPGRERWWDGTQWTAHEREVAALPDAPIVPATIAAPVPTAAAAAGAGYAVAPGLAPMGWYPVAGTADTRWWDGTAWTPYRVREGRPKPDALAIEPAGTGMVLGILFLAVGLLQLSTALFSRSVPLGAAPVLFLFAGVIWLVGAAHTSSVRKLPAPAAQAMADAAVRPLPGEVEGQGAGWYPVTGQASRWWTGTRWSWYVGMKIGVRPGHAGPRGYRVSLVMGWIVAATGVVGAIVSLVVGSLLGTQDATIGGIIMVLGLGASVVLGGLGAFLLLLTRARRYAMILPTSPPPVR